MLGLVVQYYSEPELIPQSGKLLCDNSNDNHELLATGAFIQVSPWSSV